MAKDDAEGLSDLWRAITGADQQRDTRFGGR
jgi:hypothetical protein